MAGVSSSGWTGKSFQELIDELAAEAKVRFGEDFPTTPDSVFGQLANIFAASSKDLWDLGQAITDSQNRDAATGIYLDYLANLIGLSRIKASGATGNLLFTGEQNAVVPSFFPAKDGLNRNVLTQAELTLNRSNCYQSTFSVAELQDSSDYTINVEGIAYTFTTGVSPTVSIILNGLDAAMAAATSFTSAVVGETLVITYGSQDNILTTTNSDNLTLDSVGSLVAAESAETGDLSFPANSIATLGSSLLTIDSVNNPFDFVDGRAEETDEELRLRMALREQSTGTATKPSIEAALSEVSGVTGVLVVENQTLVDNPTTGVEAKSYETFIAGGNNDEIAEVLWRTKPATGHLVGDITETVIDRNGDEQVVKFSRKTEEYAWMRVTYTINSEEDFPADGEDQMRNVVVTAGNTLEAGEDYEPTKFYGPLYTVPGTYISLIEIATTPNPGDTPTYQTTRIPVDETTNLLFDVTRVAITT